MKLLLKKGTTSYRAYIFVQNSSVTTGAGLTGLLFNSAGLTAYYVRPGAAAAAVTLATQTVTGAYSSGGFVEIDATNMPGVYRFDIPDAALATGVDQVVLLLKGAANMVPVPLEIELTAVDLMTATVDANVVSIAAGAITAASIAADAITDAKVAADVTIASVTGAVGSVTGAVGSVAAGGIAAASFAAGAINAAAIADGAIDRATFAADTGLQTIRSNTAQAGAAGTITLDAGASATTDFYVGAWIVLTGATGVGQARVITAYNGTTKVATIAPNWATNPDVTSTFAIINAAQLTGIQGNVTGSVASVTGAVGSVTGAVGSVTGAVGSVTGAVGSVTGNVGGNVVGSVASVTAAVTVGTNNDKAGYALSAAGDAAVADKLLTRSVAGGSDVTGLNARNVTNALRALRNKVSIAAGTMTVTQEDDTTTAWTAAVTTAAGNPLSAIDPA